MASEIKVDTVSEKTSGSGVTIDGLLIKDGGISGDVSLIGTTPTFTIGDAGAEDAALVFDGNAQDFYIALDDSADDLLIGLGSTVGTTPAISIDENLQVKIVATTASTSATTGSFIAAGGAGVAADLHVGDDVTLISDSAVLGFGADKDTTLTHTDGTGLTLNSTNKLCFNDASQFIQGASATVLDIAATDEIELTATLIEVVGRLEVTGGVIFNEASADVDFRVESNGNANMLVVNGGGDRVGVGADPDMGVGLHIKSGDCGAGGPNAGGDELVVEGSGNTGISIMSGSSSNGTIFFGDSGNDAIGSIDYDHADNDFNITAEGTIMVNLSGSSLTINNAGSDGGVPLYVAQSTNGGQCGHISHTGTGQTADNLFLSTYTTGTGFNFIRCQSDYDSGEDDEWRVRGDGATLADGSYSSSGADYAEYFESKTGNTVAKGITVVMDGTKVKASTDSDSASSIVGVVRPKDFGKSGSVIGNAASNYWNQKYETDDFGSYVLEDVSSVEWDYRGAEDDIEGTRNHINNQTNVVSFYTDRVPASITVPADGVANKKVTTGLKRRKLNSSYDKTKTYTSREERDEWLLVGMLGQVQVTKGQKTGDRWIKMRDISETVEEWLIR